MGMYTELVMGVNLRGDTPTQVIETLKFMLGETDAPPSPLPDHSLFKCDRWRFMLRCDSYYFDGYTLCGMKWDDIGQHSELSIRCNLKNYDDEIEKFCDWLKPYFETEGFYGYSRYEEAEHPTLLYTKSHLHPGEDDFPRHETITAC